MNYTGEHIDYCGYSVLPMAIEHDIVIAASLNNNLELHLSNLEESFNDYKTRTNDVQINKDKPKWFDYFLSGHKGILDKFNLDCSKGIS